MEPVLEVELDPLEDLLRRLVCTSDDDDDDEERDDMAAESPARMVADVETAVVTTRMDGRLNGWEQEGSHHIRVPSLNFNELQNSLFLSWSRDVPARLHCGQRRVD